MNLLKILGPRLIFLSSGSESHRHGPRSAGSSENMANMWRRAELRQGDWHQGHSLRLSFKPGQKPKWTWNFELWQPVNELCFSFLHRARFPVTGQNPWILTSIHAISVTENVSGLLWLEHLTVLLSVVFSDSCEHSSPWLLIEPGTTMCPPWFTHLLPQQPQSRDHVLLLYLWCLIKYLVYKSHLSNGFQETLWMNKWNISKRLNIKISEDKEEREIKVKWVFKPMKN